MFLNKIKQNLAGFAVVALAFTGLSAIAPANATTAALADTANMGFTGNAGLTVSGDTGTTSINLANSGRGYISASIVVNQATADSFVGHQINGTLTLTGPNGVMNLAQTGFFGQNLIYAQAGTVVQQGQVGSVASMTWPTGANSTNTNILISAYINSSSFSWAQGNYSLQVGLTKDGVAQSFGAGISFSGYLEWAAPGNTIASVPAGTTWRSGFVCVDMAQVVSGDVLTVEPTQNGTPTTVSGIDWYNGGSSVMSIAYSNNRAVSSSDITAGKLAVKASAYATASGSSATMGIAVKKANGTDVSVSCAPTAAPTTAPVATSMGNISATFATNGYTGFQCALFDSSNNLVTGSVSTTSSSPCGLVAGASGTYTVKYSYTNYGVGGGSWSPASNAVSYTYLPPMSSCGVAATSIHATVSQLDTTNSFTTYFNNDVTKTNCFATPITGGYGTRTTLNGTQVGSAFYTAGSVSPTASLVPRTLAVLMSNPSLAAMNPTNGALYRVSYYQGISAAPTANDVPFMYYEITLNPSGNSNSNSNSNSNNNVQQQVQQSAPVVPTNIPLVAPIAAPKLGVTPGAALVLSGANMSTVSSIKIDATATTTKTTVGGVEIQVPANLTPGAHDLLITTTTGSTLYVGAIKVADPMVVAAKQAVAKAAASIAYRAPVDLTVGKAVSAAQASQVKALASQYRGAKTAICEAIPASKATVASARAAAVAVCATIKAAIPGVKTLIVIGAPSGAKSNRVSSEIQG